VRCSILRSRVDNAGLLTHGGVEHRTDVGRVVLAVLIESDDPVAPGGGHPGERRGVLAEVATQPDGMHHVVLRGERADGVGGAVGPVVEDEQHLRHDDGVALGSGELLGHRVKLGDQTRERPLALVDRYDERDAMGRARHGVCFGRHGSDYSRR
jgi:hypothetical protein